jgi:uncharacterized membrane protein
MATSQRVLREEFAPATREEIQELSRPKDRGVNVSRPERWASVIGGALLAAYGVNRGVSRDFDDGGWAGWALTAAGAALVYRGATGHCDVYGALGINTAAAGDAASVRHGAGVKVEKSVLINKSREELYRFWRNFENLPRFMRHLEGVRVLDDKRSHWAAKAPAGRTVEWDAEIFNEQENELIAWRSLEGSDVANAGSVRFEQAPGGRGTLVKVALSYEPPGGTLGRLAAKLFGEEPEQQVDEDLRRFKQLIETGEIATTEGQTSGRARSQAGR